MSKTVTWSKTVTFFEGDWHDGNVPIMGPRTHAAWLCTSVFDGARAFEGVTPDLDLHCALFTPVANGTFLAGITRRRVIALLQDVGATVMETTLRYCDFQAADEIFCTGNYSKVTPVTRIDDRQIPPGPFYRKARELYWDYAHAAVAAAA